MTEIICGTCKHFIHWDGGGEDGTCVVPHPNSAFLRIAPMKESSKDCPVWEEKE